MKDSPEPTLQWSSLEAKDREELFAIAEALGTRPSSRAKKSDLIVQIMRAAGVEVEEEPAKAPASRQAPPFQPGEPGRLFISHSSADRAVADELAELLRLGTDLPRTRIFCTSLEGMGIPEGVENYIAYLRSQLRGATLVLPLLTPTFFESQVCLVELGAMWGVALPTFPLIVPPAKYAQLEAVLGKVQCARIDQSSDLARLRDLIVKSFDLDAPTDLWEAKLRRFMTRWDLLKSGIALPMRVSPADHAKALERVASVEAENAELLEALYATQDQLEQVSALKDRAEVAALLVPSDERSQFDELVRTAADLLDRLPPVIRRAFYQNLGRDQSYVPDEYDAIDADSAVRDDQLIFDEDSGGYWINDDDPEVGETASAVRSFFRHEWSQDLLDAFTTEHRKNFSPASEPTWRVLGLL